jgi:hypothetical protein
MQRFANEKSIQRKAKLGKILTLTGFGVLIGSLVLSFTQPQLSNQLLMIAFGGTLLIQIGFAYTNRWGKRPRTDEIIDQSLKGLNSNFAIFHYLLGADHVLFTPSGLYVFIPSIEEGEIRYEDGDWWQSRIRRGKVKQKRLKQLPSNAQLEVRTLARSLNKKLASEELPPITPVLVFLHPQSTIHAVGSSPEGIHFKKLKSFLRKRTKQASISGEKISQLAESLGV